MINRGPEAFSRYPDAVKKMKYINRTNHGLLVTTIVAHPATASIISAFGTAFTGSLGTAEGSAATKAG